MTKSFTDLEQSKKLAEILPLKSADQTWVRIAIAGVNLDVPEELQYMHNGDMSTHYYMGVGIPCWSLAALLDVLPSVIKRKGKRIFLTLEKAGAYNLYYKSPDRLDELWETNEEPIDACVEMIIRLNELKML